MPHGSDIRKASGFVITTEPLGFVLTKEVNVFLLRVWDIPGSECPGSYLVKKHILVPLPGRQHETPTISDGDHYPTGPWLNY